ncbi:MAG: aminotransferase class I/II-fold pyridoxal phosphate-dependent enzyme [Phycisphaerales bacterium]|jgi:aspartate/methionine/tyrosine aminotransferase|nr:aminotransferase class I/II-fold pyridoxal phosphate-dependent enzyme [Phycisphaerales bacterium]
MDWRRVIADRVDTLPGSGVRRIFDLATRMRDPVNLSIGQPDFPVPEAIKRGAIEAISGNDNGYSNTLGVPALRTRVAQWLGADLGWDDVAIDGVGAGSRRVIITSGTSGAIYLAFMAMLAPGDEVILPDPYFVAYPPMALLCGAKPVYCDTYPDFRMTAERVEKLITPRTKAVLFNTPSNPGGVVASSRECRDMLDLCRARGIVLISDEIYDEFTYPAFRTERTSREVDGAFRARCPSPARTGDDSRDVLLIRGFGKTYGVTGWRLGYAAGPRDLIEAMAKMQQFTFVCPPTPLQAGVACAYDVDMDPVVLAYQKRRDMVVSRLREVTEVPEPGGAFYAFAKVPERLGLSATAFVERCVEREVLVVPGGAFSSRDTHIRLSYAVREDKLERGLSVLCELLRG